MVVLKRFTVLVFAVTVVLGFCPPQAEATGRRARLSQDLVQRLAAGHQGETDVIVTGTPERIARIAARHGLVVRKPLKNGAALTVPAGLLEAVTADAEVDAMS